MVKRSPPARDRIVDAALKLAAERSWRQISSGDIARAAKVSLTMLHKNFKTKTSIVIAVMERVDQILIKGIDPFAAGEPPRDRLLDALMRRFDALTQNKAAICSILREVTFEPASIICLAPHFYSSMAWTLESAGISPTGIFGGLRVKGLAVIYIGALVVWSRDETPDQAKTQAYLDRRLHQAEILQNYFSHDNPFSKRARH